MGLWGLPRRGLLLLLLSLLLSHPLSFPGGDTPGRFGGARPLYHYLYSVLLRAEE